MCFSFVSKLEHSVIDVLLYCVGYSPRSLIFWIKDNVYGFCGPLLFKSVNGLGSCFYVHQPLPTLCIIIGLCYVIISILKEVGANLLGYEEVHWNVKGCLLLVLNHVCSLLPLSLSLLFSSICSLIFPLFAKCFLSFFCYFILLFIR